MNDALLEGRVEEKTSKKSAMPGPGTIAIPATDWMWTLSVHALSDLLRPPGSDLLFTRYGAGAAEKRNAAVETFLADSASEWIFFLDADMTPEPKTLLWLLSLDAPIAGALCYYRVPPFMPVVGLLPGQEVLDLTKGPFEVAYTGGAALLVRREVLEALHPGPYFEYHPGTAKGNDVNFCKLARAAGFPILIDPDVEVGHVGAVPVDQQLATAYWGGGVADPRLDGMSPSIGKIRYHTAPRKPPSLSLFSPGSKPSDGCVEK